MEHAANLYPRLVEMLRMIEEEVDNCPSCGGYIGNPPQHRENCELAKLLAETDDVEPHGTGSD